MDASAGSAGQVRTRRDGDILHAYRNPVRVWDLGEGFTMILGPNRAAIILEVGYVDGEQTHVIVHAKPARNQFLR